MKYKKKMQSMTPKRRSHPLNSFAVLLLLLGMGNYLPVANAKIGSASISSSPRRRLQLAEFMCSLFGVLVDSLCEEDDGNDGEEDENGAECPSVQPLSNETGVFDLERFTEYSWFVQKQQISGFQYSPEDEFYCLTMTYTQREDDEFYHFENFGLSGGVNGTVNEWDGDKTDNWCAGQDRYGGGLLRISPCVLRPLLVRVGIPQWILAVADDYSWAIMSGGEPSELVELNDVNSFIVAEEDEDEAEQPQQQPLCTTRTNITEDVLLDTSGSGLWILTRERIASNGTIAMMEQLLLDMGIYTGELFPVTQEGCTYDNATLVEE